jgi:hypothetical protein
VPRNCVDPRQQQQQQQFSPDNSHSTAAGQPAQPGSDGPQWQQVQQLQVLQQVEQQEQQDTDADLEYQQNLCRSLRGENCSSVEQLVAVIAEHGPYMDGQAVTACFTAAARLGRQLAEQQQQQQQHTVASNKLPGLYQLAQVLEEQLLPLLQPKLHQLDAQGLQMVLYSLASLQYKQEVLVLQLVSALGPSVLGDLRRCCSLMLASLLQGVPACMLTQQPASV